MKVLDLFSGIGGISLGLERAGMKTVAFCEIEPFPRAVLAKHWPDIPCFEDIRALDAETLDLLGIDRPDIIAGGFPCQDISVAGKGKGIEHGERSGLWREMYRLIHEIRPRWVLAENVPALRTRGADRVISDLEAAGYTIWPVVVGAWAVGAPHKRDRVWIVARRLENTVPTRPSPQQTAERAESDSVSASGRIFELVHADEGRLSRQSTGTEAESSGNRENDGLPESASASVANAKQMRRGPGAGVSGDEEGERRGRAESARSGSGVGQADSCGAGRQERYSTTKSAESGHGAGCAYVGELADPKSEQNRRLLVTGVHGNVGGTSAWRFPARPGEPQHEWEAPRLEWPVGDAAHGLSERLVRFANRNNLKAGGNSVVPQVVEMIGRAIMRAEGLL